MTLSANLSVVVCMALALAYVDALSLRYPANEQPRLRQMDLIRLMTSYSEPSIELPSSQDALDTVTNPDFCHNLDCPSYKVISSTDDYELREYEASRWVSTNQMGVGYDGATNAMFWKLFQYIEGWNADLKLMDMTSPVITQVTPGDGPTAESNFTMSFFISPKVKDPPAPRDESVFLSEIPKMRVFVSSFGGIESGKDWIAQAGKLAAILETDGRKFDSSAFFTAGYDSPFRLLFRHNEVWFMALE